jgi:hypothetical protein
MKSGSLTEPLKVKLASLIQSLSERLNMPCPCTNPQSSKIGADYSHEKAGCAPRCGGMRTQGPVLNEKPCLCCPQRRWRWNPPWRSGCRAPS